MFCCAYILKVMSEEQLKQVWLESGRPGVAKLYPAAARAGIPATRRAIVNFIKAQETRQIFAPPPRSNGRVVSTRIDDTWQADLIDFKKMDDTRNEEYRVVLVVVDVSSRFTGRRPWRPRAWPMS